MIALIQDEFSSVPTASQRWKLRHPEKAAVSSKFSREKYQKLYPERYLFYNAKSGAQQRGIEFTITQEDIQIPTHCPVLGIELYRNSGKRSRWANSPTVDRIDNSKGYVPGNICVISWRANDIKGDANIEELERVLHYMKEHSKCAD